MCLSIDDLVMEFRSKYFWEKWFIKKELQKDLFKAFRAAVIDAGSPDYHKEALDNMDFHKNEGCASGMAVVALEDGICLAVHVHLPAGMMTEVEEIPSEQNCDSAAFHRNKQGL